MEKSQSVVTVTGIEVGCSSTGHTAFAGSPLCTLVVPNCLLLCLHDNRADSFTAGVNACIKEQIITLDTSSTRLESALRRVAGRLATKKKSCKGSRDRKRVIDGVSKILVGEGETVSTARITNVLQVRTFINKLYYIVDISV